MDTIKKVISSLKNDGIKAFLTKVKIRKEPIAQPIKQSINP